MSNKAIKAIRIVFENIEVSDYLSCGNDCYKDDVYAIFLSNVKTNIYSKAMNWIAESREAEKVQIILNPSADRTSPNFFPAYDEDTIMTLFQRIKAYNDITTIELTYTDDTIEDICVPWCDNEYTNSYQVNYYDENDKERLIISIAKQNEDGEIF